MRIGKYIVYTFLIAIVFATSIVMYWLYGPDKVLDVHNAPTPVRPAVQRSDELVFVVINYCKFLSSRGTIRRSLVSASARIMLPLQTDTTPVTCQQLDNPVLIPKGTVPDLYHLHFDIQYQINPLNSVIESFDTQDFTVE